MIVIPVTPALSIETEQNSFKTRKNNPAFGLHLTRETQQFLEQAADLAVANPKSRFKKQLIKLMEVIDEATSPSRENDGLQLEITNPLWEGIEAFTMDARLKLENIGRAVGEKAQSLTKIVITPSDTLEEETIIDVALNLLADNEGKALHPIRLHEAIIKAQEHFDKGVEHVRLNVVDPLRKRISDAWDPEIQAS